jgi:urease accessory protein
MGGPEMAPYTPPLAGRSSPGLDRSCGQPDTSCGQPATARDQNPAPGAPEVPLITSARVEVREADLAGLERDALMLTAEERRWGRRRVTTTAGRALVLALPTGSVLRLGSVLHVAADWYVVVEGALEPVLAFTPASPEEALRVAFEVGNRHFTLALDGERVLVPDDPAMGHLLTRLDVRFERVRTVFAPIGMGHRHDR